MNLIWFRNLWNEKPLVVILVIAAILRLIAVVFAKGYGMHDDHFLVIEPAQAWVDGIDNDGWLPMFREGATPSGHSLFFPGLHYLLFSGLQSLGLTDPQAKMYIVRLLLAAFSMLTVLWGYRLALKTSGAKVAAQAGLILAALWIFPNLSVRNLVEVFCIPFLMYGVWRVLRDEPEKLRLSDYLISGLVMGLAFSVRFQTVVFAAGFGLGLIILGRIRGVFVFGVAYISAIVLIQGGIDMLIWGRPFAEFQEYARYNMTHSLDYITMPWYHYIVIILAFLIPPISIAIFAGFLKSWRKHLLIFLPVVIFIAFHSIYPNKQERFILPAIPFIIIIGLAGWNVLQAGSTFWQKRQSWLRNSWIFFWVLNVILLIPVTVMYSKKARVEAMTYLSRYSGITTILNEDTNHGSAKMLPRFYLGQWPKIISVTRDRPLIQYLSESDSTSGQPDFVLFAEQDKLDFRVKQMQSVFPGLVYETVIEPGWIDALLYRLNPNNTNQTLYIYRNTAKQASKKILP